VEPQSQAIDGGAGDLIVWGGGLEETPNFCNTEDGGKAVCGWRSNQGQSVPITLEEVLVEEAEATGAEAHGSWGEAIGVFAVQEGGLEFRFGDHLGRFAIELS
jgi:hypothetical protein